MLGDLLKLVELLLKELRGVKSPESKRLALVRKLKELYLSLDEAVEAGAKVQVLLANGVKLGISDHPFGGPLPEPVTETEIGNPLDLERLLLKKQGAVQRAFEALESEAVQSVVKIRLPKLRALSYILDGRSRDILFFLSQLTSDAQLTSDGRIQELDDALNKYGVGYFGYDPRKIIGSMREYMDYPEYAYEDPGWKTWRRLYGSHVVATASELDHFNEILKVLQVLKEELRLFLVSEFTVEELSG